MLDMGRSSPLAMWTCKCQLQGRVFVRLLDDQVIWLDLPNQDTILKRRFWAYLKDPLQRKPLGSFAEQVWVLKEITAQA